MDDENQTVTVDLQEMAERMICSGDKNRAIEGRFVRDVVPAMLTWWETEMEGIDPDDLMDVLGGAFGRCLGVMLPLAGMSSEGQAHMSDLVAIRAALASREMMGAPEDLADLMVAARGVQEVIQSLEMTTPEAEEAGDRIARDLKR